MQKRLYPRREFLRQIGCFTTTLSFLSLGRTNSLKQTRPNVLFIAVDDLRPQLGCYGNREIISPNINKLAEQGIMFDRAYCQEPICMASRASLMSGCRPDYANIYNCDSLQNLAPEVLTLNKHFENNGYQVWATGKIYHHQEDHQAQFGKNWINPNGDWVGRGYLTREAKAEVAEYQKVYHKIYGGDSNGRGPAFEAADVSDNSYSDGKKTELAIEQLIRFSNSEKPFFLAVGYNKPHLPFNAPKKYWDMYDSKNIKLADNPFLPENATEFTPYNYGELRNYSGIPKDNKTLPNSLARQLIHGYYACVSYVDSQIGKLTEAFDRLNLKENTIIVLWGDHGWKLGEHGMWCKHTPFELDAKVPLVFRVPGLKQQGKNSNVLAEFVDIYPTLCDLCGLEKPNHLEGDSLLPVIKNPEINWKEAAFTQWPKVARTDPEKVITAYSIKTDRYRYIEWTRNKTRDILARELYDHTADPNENVNIANLNKNKKVIGELSWLLDGGKGWVKLRR